MKKFSTAFFLALLGAVLSFGQSPFIPAEFDSLDLLKVVLPASPIKSQVLFIGGVDKVQCVDKDGKPNGETEAKQWHDFIGFTPDDKTNDLGWVTVNHEMTLEDDLIGDGGGCTVFKIKRQGDTIAIVEQTLEDGRKGNFFNVDFVNIVGQTGMNCGGIVSPIDGRIWTAEEWWRYDNKHLKSNGFRDTTDYTVKNSNIAAFEGKTLKRYQNLNYMVELDPRKAKAIRKQYNWGRQPFEGGVLLKDNKTVFIGSDATPGILTKFVAKTAGDFTDGTTYVYSEAAKDKWVEIDNSVMENMLNYTESAAKLGATLFNRLEWFAYDKENEMVYITETGRDDAVKPVSKRMEDATALGGKPAKHLIDLNKTRFNGDGTKLDENFQDYYGRILKLDPSTDEITVHLEGGPYFKEEAVKMADYPDVHLSNPDGLNVMRTQGKNFLLICEDLNGKSHGRVPAEHDFNKTNELYMLDLSVKNPTYDDLKRIAIVPVGAEVTGVIAIDDKTILVDSQHPKGSNTYPYNNSLTLAFSGWDKVNLDGTSSISEQAIYNTKSGVRIFPNPTLHELHFSEQINVEIFDLNGTLILTKKNVNYVNVESLKSGVYYVRTGEKDVQKLIVE